MLVSKTTDRSSILLTRAKLCIQKDVKIGTDEELYYDNPEQEGNPLVYLPHSCGEWVIGTKENVEQLIEDLQELLKQF